MSEDTLENVHIFDGKLKNLYNPENIYTDNEKKEILKKFLNKLEKFDNFSKKLEYAILTVNTILKDIDVESSDNYDETNKIDASQLLSDICNKDIDEIMEFIIEQLADAYKLGICAQGRSVRLLQIWNAL